MSQPDNRPRVVPEYLKDEEELSSAEIDHIQETEIERINSVTAAEVFGESWCITTAEDREIAYKALVKYVHPDRQPQDRKDAATRAQQKLQEAKELSGIVVFMEPNAPGPKGAHRNRFWGTPTMKGACRGLQCEPGNQVYQYWLESINQNISDFNNGKDWDPESGKFPFLYLQHQYTSAKTLRQRYSTLSLSHNLEQEIKAIRATYQCLCSAIADYCKQKKYPDDWALQHDDISKGPEHTEDSARLQRGSTATDTQSAAPQSQWANIPQDGIQSNGQQPDSGQPPANGQPPESSGQPQQPSQQNGPPQTNHQPPQHGQSGQPPQQQGQQGQQGQPQSNGQSQPRQPPRQPGQNFTLPNLNVSSESMNIDTSALTVRNETVLARRKVYKTTQYLVEKADGQKEWQAQDICGARNAEDTELVARKESWWLKERKGKYKGIRWLALAFDGAISIGAGSYPPVTMMIEWIDNVPDSMMWRSDVIKVTSTERVERDMERHLPWTKFVNYEGRKIFIMAQTESGLLTGQQKAVNKIMKEDSKLVKNMTTPRQFAQPPAPPIFGLLGSAQNGMSGPLVPYGAQGPTRRRQFQGQDPALTQSAGEWDNSAMVPHGGTPQPAQPIELASIVDSMKNLMLQQNLNIERLLSLQTNPQTLNQSQQQPSPLMDQQQRQLTNYAHQQQPNQSNNLPTGQQQLTNYAHQQTDIPPQQPSIQPNQQPSFPPGPQPNNHPTPFQQRQGPNIMGQYPTESIGHNPDTVQAQQNPLNPTNHQPLQLSLENSQQSQGSNLPSGPSANRQPVQNSGPVGQQQQQQQPNQSNSQPNIQPDQQPSLPTGSNLPSGPSANRQPVQNSGPVGQQQQQQQQQQQPLAAAVADDEDEDMEL